MLHNPAIQCTHLIHLLWDGGLKKYLNLLKFNLVKIFNSKEKYLRLFHSQYHIIRFICPTMFI